MRRVHALLVVVALLAAPLALVAHVFAVAADGCNGYCCLPHGHRARHSQNQSPDFSAETMKCHHGNASQAMNCAMRTGHPGMDLGLLAPLVPTIPSQLSRISAPSASQRILVCSDSTIAAGFRAAPFEPPRA